MTHPILQLKTFDGPDNRKTILDCFRRMGRNVTDDIAGSRRAGFLMGLSCIAGGAFGNNPIIVEGKPTVAEAYELFIQIVAHIGKPIEQAAELLEAAVKMIEKGSYGMIL